MSALVVCTAGLATGRASDDHTLTQEDSNGQPSVNAQLQPSILEPIVKETPKTDYDSPVPAEVSGRVLLHTVAGLRSGEETSGAKGVSVTDGYLR
jgi:hypothetical protein